MIWSFILPFPLRLGSNFFFLSGLYDLSVFFNIFLCFVRWLEQIFMIEVCSGCEGEAYSDIYLVEINYNGYYNFQLKINILMLNFFFFYQFNFFHPYCINFEVFLIFKIRNYLPFFITYFKLFRFFFFYRRDIKLNSQMHLLLC